MHPVVLNKKHGNIPKEAVYVGRPSKYGNPFKVGVHGSRQECVEKFRTLVHEGHYPELRSDLKGKDLVCWCAPEPCHADVLLEIANAPE